MTKQLRSDLLLMMITVFWGASYILTKIGLQELDPYSLTAYRFIIAFIISAAVFYKNLLKADINTYKYAFVLAVILFGVFVSQTFGLQYTTASNAGFLVSLTVVFIPIISWIALKQRIEGKVILGVGIAIIGIGLLSLNSQFSIGGGDLLCILCAVLFAVHIIATGIFTKQVDSISLGVLQLGFVGLFNAAFALGAEDFKLPAEGSTWLAILFLSILCTAVGYIIQTTAQRYTSASHTGLILSLEPVFSAIFAYLLLGEILTPRGYIGAALLLLSVLIAELNFKNEEQSCKDADLI